VRQQEWESLFGRSAQWLRLFGSNVPLGVVAADPDSRLACDVIAGLAGNEPAYALVQGDSGSGKSTLVAAAQAALIDASVVHVVLDARRPDTHRELLAALGRDSRSPVVIMDNSDTAMSSVRSLLDRRALLAGLFLTATRVGSDIALRLSGTADYYVRLPHLQLRHPSLLLVASMVWRELLGSGANLSAVCDDSAVNALVRGPLPTGAWTLREVLNVLVSQLIADGDIVEGVLRRRVTGVDIASAVAERMAAAFSPAPPQPEAIVVLVEGITDAAYLRCAAGLAKRTNGWDLLEGLSLESVAAGRGGGGEAVTARLLSITDRGVSAIGVYDNDRPGRRAAKLAQDRGRRRLLIPQSLDPLGRAGEEVIVEIEDLLPAQLLEDYYRETPESMPQERHWYNGYWRIVPGGADKQRLAEWVASCADYTQIEAIVCLLCRIRRQVDLPVPSDVPSFPDWERQLLARRRKDPTAGLPGR
jgi:energy-coupling factor transporter ATP-binding protein EcfA2